MRILRLALGLSIAVGAGLAACGGDETGDTFCTANETSYCQCKNGDAGSHDCNGDGTGFGACFEQISGEECPERPTDDDDDTSASSNPSGDPGGPGGSGPGGGGAGGDGGGTGDGVLYAACGDGSDCDSGLCAPDGYCTKECATYQECNWPEGDCPAVGVPAEDAQHCAPACGAVEDGVPQPDPAKCDAFGLYCGYAKAVDGVATLVCNGWPDGINLPPDGTECDFDAWESLQCNLGNAGTELVCSGFGCTADACYVDEDCPTQTECSSPDGSTLGTCN